MATNKTSFLNMNDWVGTDQFRREEINANFRALDAKAKEHEDKIDEVTSSLAEISTNVKSKGAKGDGVSDDLTIIQSNALSNKVLYLPAGSFKISNLLNLDNVSNLTIIGVKGQTTLLCSSLTFGIKGTNSQNIHIENIIIDYSTTPTVRSNDHAIDFINSNNITVKNIKVVKAEGMGIVFEGSQNIKVEDCEVYDTLADGIHFMGCSGHLRVLNNKLIRTGDDGIAINNYSPNPAESIDSIIAFNTIEDGNARGILIDGGVDILVISNQIRNKLSAGILVGADLAYNGKPSKRVTVSENTIFNCGTGGNIQDNRGSLQVGEWNANGELYNKVNEDIQFINNRIINAAKAGIVAWSVKGLKIEGNSVIDSNTSNGAIDSNIEVYKSDFISIVNNTVIERRVTPRSGLGVVVYNDSNYGVVSLNVITGTKNPRVDVMPSATNIMHSMNRDANNQQIITYSPNGTKYGIFVDDGGTVRTFLA